jgi:hypothetical protein
MSRTSRLGVVAGIVTAGVLLLTGCEPTTGTAGQSGCAPGGLAAFQPDHCQAAEQGEPGSEGLGTVNPDTPWVVSGFGYSGPRGGPGRHYVECRPDDDTSYDRTVYGHGAWKEVDGYRDDGSLTEGDPCPSGGTIYDDGPIRQDGGS